VEHVRRAKVDARWSRRIERRQGDPAYRDEWWAQPCGACLWWVPLSGGLGSDWGACRNGDSHRDQTVVFEHDGCDHFRADGRGWSSPWNTAPVG
jgi:hypothetical protein